MRLRVSCVALGVAFFPVAAWADVHVTRGPDASDCPDSAALTKATESLLARTIDGDSARVDVVFSRDAGVYRAVVSSGGVRALRDDGARCDALAGATAATVALIFDGRNHAEPSAVEQEQRPPPPPPVPPVPIIESRERPTPVIAEAAPRFHVAAGGAAISGMSPAVAHGGFAELAWRPDRRIVVPLTLSGFTDRVAFSPGSVDVTLAVAGAGACFAPASAGISFALCGGVAAGMLQGSGDGLATNRTVRHAVVGATAGAELHGPIAGPFGWNVRASALAPLGRDGFSVDGGGTVARLAPVALVAGAGIGMTIP